MSKPHEFVRRPVPSFAKWLEQHGDGSRGDGFAPFVDLVDRLLAPQVGEEDPSIAAFGRMLRGACIAVIEIARIEEAKGVLSLDKIVVQISRVLGFTAMYATASILKEDTPWREIASILHTEFRAGANMAADQMFAAEGGAT